MRSLCGCCVFNVHIFAASIAYCGFVIIIIFGGAMATVILHLPYYPTLAQISFVYSEHLALPPRSPVRYLASLITAKQAAWILSA